MFRSWKLDAKELRWSSPLMAVIYSYAWWLSLSSPSWISVTLGMIMVGLLAAWAYSWGDWLSQYLSRNVPDEAPDMRRAGH